MNRISRRSFLRAAVGSAAAPALLQVSGCYDPDAAWRDVDLARGARFPAGVVAGSPTRDSILLVAQVEGWSGTPRLGIDLAEDPLLHRVISRGMVDLPRDPALPLRVRLREPALRPGTPYYYRFVSHGGSSGVARFTTLRAEDDARPSRLAFFSCQGFPAGYYTAHAGLAAEPDLDLVLSLGDYIYEWTDDTGPEDRIDPIGQGGFAQTLEEYRAKYRLYRSDPNLQAMHAAQSMIAIWDNHDLGDALMHRQPPPVFSWAQRRDHGRQAFWEQMPMEPGPPERALYRSIRVGAHMEIFLLDVHTYADEPGANATYLGEKQLAWLLDGLASSRATWKIIASPKVMMNIEVVSGEPINLEQWDGYPAERRRLVEGILARGVQGVVTVTGDLHVYLAGQVTPSGRLGEPAGLVEFCGGSITSQGLFNLTPESVTAARGLEREARARNPHVRYMNILDRGYAVLEAGPESLSVVFRSPATVYERQSPTRDLARFHLRLGSQEIEVSSYEEQ